jgi:hypothetical protein
MLATRRCDCNPAAVFTVFNLFSHRAFFTSRVLQQVPCCCAQTNSSTKMPIAISRHC